MKASWFVSVLSMSLAFFGAPACGGSSDGNENHSTSGGQGGADAAGGAGEGAGPSTHVSECETLCERTVDAGCTYDDTSCLLVCSTVTGYASCQSPIEDWLKCAENSDVVCDDSGAPSFADCETEFTLVSACALTTTPPKAVATSCKDFCSEVDEAGCDVESELGDCNQTCGLTGSVVSLCQTAFVEYMECQTDAGVTCDESGSPAITGCESEQLVYLGCVMSEVGQGTTGT